VKANYSPKERADRLIDNTILCLPYIVALALNDLYGWTKAAEKVGAAVAEMLTGYAEQTQQSGSDIIGDLKREAAERGIVLDVGFYKKR